MATLIELLAGKTTDELRELTTHKVQMIAVAAQAVLDTRPDAARGEEFLRRTFPPHSNPFS